tara:strand:+ start:496 stop:780 length:285 start_codon:yes stop_codon:yes gene_type:complete
MEGINTIIIPTKVEFNSADYLRLLKQIKLLEDTLEEKEKRLEDLTTDTTTFFQKLSMIADVTRLNIGLHNYELILDFDPRVEKLCIWTRNGQKN